MPYLKTVPRTVTAGPIWQAGHEYPFGDTVTVRAPDLTKIQHFVCATSPTCKYEPSIHTSDWKWTEAGVWMCDIKPGWSACAAYLVGDHISYQGGIYADGSPAMSAFRCDNQAGCREHAPKALNGDLDWYPVAGINCPQ